MLGLSLGGGVITLGLSGGPLATNVCSVKTGNELNGIDAEVCKVLYSSLLSAKAAGKKVMIRFYDHEQCDSSDMYWKSAGKLGWTKQMEN